MSQISYSDYQFRRPLCVTDILLRLSVLETSVCHRYLTQTISLGDLCVTDILLRLSVLETSVCHRYLTQAISVGDLCVSQISYSGY